MPDNNIIEQDHRAIKRIVRPMLGFKSMRCARILLAGVETMHMIRKGTAALRRQASRVCSEAVLLPGILSSG
jgi:putative transposase